MTYYSISGFWTSRFTQQRNCVLSLRQGQGLSSVLPASAPVAQLDRVPDYGSGGWGFESSRARHNLLHSNKNLSRIMLALAAGQLGEQHSDSSAVFTASASNKQRRFSYR